MSNFRFVSINTTRDFLLQNNCRRYNISYFNKKQILFMLNTEKVFLYLTISLQQKGLETFKYKFA